MMMDEPKKDTVIDIGAVDNQGKPDVNSSTLSSYGSFFVNVLRGIRNVVTGEQQTSKQHNTPNNDLESGLSP